MVGMSAPLIYPAYSFITLSILLAFLMPNRIYIPQAHIITDVALHLGVFQGIVNILREALWIKSIEESNDKLY